MATIICTRMAGEMANKMNVYQVSMTADEQTQLNDIIAKYGKDVYVNATIQNGRVSFEMDTSEIAQTNSTAAPAPAAVPQAAPAPVAQESSFDWGGMAKTTGLFVAGAAVGAAGKMAWDHFFG